MTGKILRFPTPAAVPTREELVAKVRALALTSTTMRIDHPHFKERMAERGIVMRQVLDVVRNGDCIDGPKLDQFGDWRVKFRRTSAGRRVQVVVAVKEDHFVLVTVI